MTRRHGLPLLAALTAALPAVGRTPAADTAPPDLTHSPAIDRRQTYNLGATGLRGWIHTKAADNLDSRQGQTTTASRQILVTHVGAKSPADGVVTVDDVVHGLNGKPFADDARQATASQFRTPRRPAACCGSPSGAAGRRTR